MKYRIGVPELRIITGLLMVPPYLLQPSLIVMSVQMLFLIFLAAAHGRRIKVSMILIVLFSITAVHLLQANGRVLFQAGAFAVTLESLKIGFQKGATLVGMIYLSQFMVSGRPKFPGKFGQLLSKQFLYFEHLVSTWKRPERGKFIETLDRMLFDMEEGVLNESERGKSSQLRGSDYAVQSLALLFLWAGAIAGYSGMLPW